MSLGYVRDIHSAGRALSDTVAVQIVAQLISFPVGRAWAKFLPNYRIFGVQLNPGPFNVKEHVLITIMASVGAGSAYAVCLASHSMRFLWCSSYLLRRRISLPYSGYTTTRLIISLVGSASFDQDCLAAHAGDPHSDRPMDGGYEHAAGRHTPQSSVKFDSYLTQCDLDRLFYWWHCPAFPRPAPVHE